MEGVCQVLGRCDYSTGDGAEGVSVENQIRTFAPEVVLLLHQVVKGLVAKDIGRTSSLSGPPGGLAKGALVAIQT